MREREPNTSKTEVVLSLLSPTKLLTRKEHFSQRCLLLFLQRFCFIFHSLPFISTFSSPPEDFLYFVALYVATNKERIVPGNSTAAKAFFLAPIDE